MQIAHLRNIIFLKDILLISVSAFGGAQMHLALFIRRLVDKKHYITQSELLEIYSLCQMLPGPSSTQTITGVGYRLGGSSLAILTLLVWIAPATLLMTIFSLAFLYLDQNLVMKMFRFISPVAVSFILVAAYRMIRSFADSAFNITIMFFAFGIAALLRHPLESYVKTPWIYPVVIVSAGFFSWLRFRTPSKTIQSKLTIPWKYAVVFFVLFAGTAILGKITQMRGFILFENTFRFGSLIFGGGNVLFPMMYEQFVSHKGYLNPQEFLTGIGLLQAIPGPIFSFTTFTTGLAMREFGWNAQLLGCIIGTLGIFLPGLLIMLFVYPIWDSIKHHSFIQRALSGILSASAGLVGAAAYLFFLPVGLRWKEPNNFFHSNLLDSHFIHWENVTIIAIFSLILYHTPKIPAPVWIILSILAGVLLPVS